MPDNFASLFADQQDPREGQAALYEAYLAANKSNAFRQARQKVNRYEQIFESAGLPVPEEDKTKGFVSTLFDALDTGGQAVRGVGAKLLGVEGYEDESLFGAARRGTKEDLTVGEIMREKGFLAGEDLPSSVGRGVIGFVGDVLTDPLSWVSFGAGSMGRHVIDRTLAEKMLVKTAAGDMRPVSEIVNVARKKFEIEEMARQVGDKVFPNEAIKEVVANRVRSDAEDLTLKALTNARSVVKDNQALKRSGLEKIADEELLTGLAKLKERDKLVKETLGLAEDVDLNDLFAHSAIRFSSPLAGIGAVKNLPVLGAREADIPLITKGSEAAFDLLGGQLYNMSAGIGNITRNLAQIEGLGGSIPRNALRVVSKAKSVGKLLSKRLQVGGKGAQHILNQADRQHVGATLYAEQKADAMFGPWLDATGMKHEWADADLQTMTHTLEQLRAGQLDEMGEFAKKPGDIVANEAAYQRAKASIVAQWNQDLAGKGDKAGELMDFTRQTFEQYYDDAVKDGNPHDYLDGYIAITMRGRGDLEMPKALRREMFNRIGIQNFMKHRSSMNLDDAIAHSEGFMPEMNLKKIFEARTVAQIRAKANKNFQERLGFEVALDPDTYVRLNAAVMSHNAALRNGAARLLEEKGFQFSDLFWARPKDAEKALKEYQPLRHGNGIDVSADDFDSLVAKYQQAKVNAKHDIWGGKKTMLEAEEEGRRIGVDLRNEASYAAVREKIVKDQHTFSRFLDPKGERGMFKFVRHDMNGDILRPEDWDEFVRVADTTTWNGKEEIVTPAAVDMQERLKKMGLWEYAKHNPQAMRNQLAAQEQLWEQTREKMVWLGRQGESEFERAGLETVSGKFLAAIRRKLPPKDEMFFNGLLPRPMTEAINESLETKDMLTRMAKEGGKGDAMSRHLSNVGNLYLGWVKLHKMASTLIWPGYLVRNVGSAQFQSAQNASILGESLNLVRLKETYDVARKNGHFIQEKTGEMLRWSQLRQEMAALDLDVSPKHFLELAEGQTEALSYMATGKLPKRIKELWGKYTGFTARVENYGRHNLYINLRRQGMAPSEAAEVMNKAMVDYSRGKTKFEKTVMNNSLFFYSFARGQASNTFHQMIHKPGALTAQLHAINGVREVLTNGNTDLAPDIVGEIESLRSKEGISRYLGTDEEGTHQMLTDIGMPAEDLSRFVNIHLPEKWTVGGMVDAAGTTARRTVQTAIGSTNPLIKGMIEYIATNKSLFFDRPLDDKMLRRFPEWEQSLNGLIPYAYNSIPAKALEGVDGALMKILDGRPNGDGTMTINPAAMAFLTYLVPGASRAMSTANALAKAGPTTGQKWLRLMSGIKVTEMEPENARVFERARQLETDLMREMGTTSKRAVQQQMMLMRARKREEE